MPQIKKVAHSFGISDLYSALHFPRIQIADNALLLWSIILETSQQAHLLGMQNYLKVDIWYTYSSWSRNEKTN